jgi:hypothetical protein
MRYPRRPFSRRSRRGSVLIVAMLFSLVIAISLGSYLQLATSATRLSYRTYYQGVAMNIAETGLEQAMWEANSKNATWANWQSPPDATLARRRTFDLGTVEGGAKAEVKVYAQERVGNAAPWIAARAIITPPQGPAIEKWVRVRLTRRSTLNIGGLGEEGITASGNQVEMGSWNSDPDNDPSTPPVEFSPEVMNDKMSLATTYVDATLNSGNADINGTAAVGANSTDAIQVGPQGYIGPKGTAMGTKDPNSVSANFSADLPTPEVPSASYTSLGAISSSMKLPRLNPDGTPRDAAEGGVYYYSASSIGLNGDTLAILPGYKVVMHVPRGSGDISVSGNGGAIIVESTITHNNDTKTRTYVSGQLELYTDADIKVSGQGSIINQITLQDYNPNPTKTRVTISNIEPIYGKGTEKNTVIGWSYTRTTEILNADNSVSSTRTQKLRQLASTDPVAPVAGSNTTTAGTYVATGTRVGQPINLKIFGTHTTDGAQTISISGNGNLSAVVNAPNAHISAKGGGNSGFVYGSLIGQSLKFTGNDGFYYDESLKKNEDDARLAIEDWREMISYVDRTSYMSYLNF